MSKMTFQLIERNQAGEDQTREITVNYSRLFAIGYAGRDIEKTMAHIRELKEQLGVPAPKRIPTIFQCGNYVLTQEETLHFVGGRTCGEVEYVLVVSDGTLYVGLGSDHTDRELEGMSVPKAKQICAKPISRFLWPYEELKDHWETIRLNSYQMAGGKEILYQQGTLADIMTPEKILEELNSRVGEITDAVIYSGTVPLINGFVYGTNFRCEMADEALGRTLTLSYEAVAVSEDER